MTKPRTRLPKKSKQTEGAARERLASNVKKYRLGAGHSQEVLAELAGFHRTFVSQIERGMNNVSLDGIERLANALQVDIEDLLARPV